MVSTPLILPLRKSRIAFAFVAVGDRLERSGIGRHRLEHFFEFDGRHAVILIHHANLKILDFAAKRIAQHDQLHQRHDHRNDDQRRAAAETPQVAFNDGPDAMHVSFTFA